MQNSQSIWASCVLNECCKHWISKAKPFTATNVCTLQGEWAQQYAQSSLSPDHPGWGVRGIPSPISFCAPKWPECIIFHMAGMGVWDPCPWGASQVHLFYNEDTACCLLLPPLNICTQLSIVLNPTWKQVLRITAGTVSAGNTSNETLRLRILMDHKYWHMLDSCATDLSS